MRYSSQVKPISYLKANAAEVLAHLAEQREPMVITQNGEAKAVLQDVASFEETQETLALLKILALGNQDVAAGKVKSVADVVARLSATPLTWNRWSVRWFSTACATRNPSLARCSGKTVHRLAQLINDVPERFAELLLVVFSHDSDVA